MCSGLNLLNKITAVFFCGVGTKNVRTEPYTTVERKLLVTALNTTSRAKMRLAGYLRTLKSYRHFVIFYVLLLSQLDERYRAGTTTHSVNCVYDGQVHQKQAKFIG